MADTRFLLWNVEWMNDLFVSTEGDTRSVLGDRRDYLLVRHGPFKVTGAQLVGATLEDRTPSGLWPSDHAGVVVHLRIPTG